MLQSGETVLLAITVMVGVGSEPTTCTVAVAVEPPDEVVVERGLRHDLIQGLEGLGHTVREDAPHTSANSILATPQGFAGAADPRSRGALAAGY